MKIGELQTTQDINKKYLMGELDGDEVWSFESKCSGTGKQK